MSLDHGRAMEISRLLRFISAGLDIPEALDQRARAEYERLAAWLSGDNQSRYNTNSRLFPQGSYSLGTVIAPVSDDQDYDVDIIYCRERRKDGISKSELRAVTGSQLEQYVNQYERISGGHIAPKLTPNRRCWTLQFDGFHLDVVPAIPDEDAVENNHLHAECGLLITDEEARLWLPTNPEGFQKWFRAQEKRHEQHLRFAEGRTEVTELPDGEKSQLQRIVQLLKRHRDVTYTGEHPPVSVVITALAAKAYRPRPTLLEALIDVVNRLRDFVEPKGHGLFFVSNPVNKRDDFTEKWGDPAKMAAFFQWLERVETDLGSDRFGSGLPKFVESAGHMFGPDRAKHAASQLGKSTLAERKAGTLRSAAGAGATLGSAGKPVPKHNFYGAYDETDEETPTAD